MCSCQIADSSVTCFFACLDLETIIELGGQRARMGVDTEQKIRTGLGWRGGRLLGGGGKSTVCRVVTL